MCIYIYIYIYIIYTYKLVDFVGFPEPSIRAAAGGARATREGRYVYVCV